MPKTKKLKPTLEGDAENEKAKYKNFTEELIELKPMLTAYTIKAVIPTASFANIQPEISVFAHTLEQAEEFVLPHIDKLFVKYFNAYQNGVPEVKSMQPESKSMQKETNLPKTATVSASKGTYADVSGTNAVVPPPPNPMKTDACIKAEQAINGCTSLEALTLVKSKVENSVKLTPEEKVVLAFAINTKNDELFKQTNPI
jgi:hypothetical protein